MFTFPLYSFIPHLLLFRCVQRDPTPRLVLPSLHWPIILLLFYDFYCLTSLLLPRWSSDRKYGPYPPVRDLKEAWHHIRKFTPVSYRTLALWGRCPAFTQLLQLIISSRASSTADHVRSLDDFFFSFLFFFFFFLFFFCLATIVLDVIKRIWPGAKRSRRSEN